jgi:hypothetical protein
MVMPREALNVQRSDRARPAERIEADHFAHWLEPIHDLNRRMLALLAVPMREHEQYDFHAETSIGHALRDIDAAAREQLARCPFLLIDASFNNAANWTPAEYADVAQQHHASPQVLALARATCVLSWYLVRTDHVAAMLALGLSQQSAVVIARSGLTQLQEVAARLVEQRSFRPRWHDRPDTWRRLIRMAQASPPKSVAIHALQLFLGDLLDHQNRR